MLWRTHAGWLNTRNRLLIARHLRMRLTMQAQELYSLLNMDCLWGSCKKIAVLCEGSLYIRSERPKST